MKKLVTTGLKGNLFIVSALLAMSMGIPANRLQAQSGCILTCPLAQPVEISLSSQCKDTLTYEILGVTATNCPGDITVDIFENGVSIGDTLSASMIGNTYMVVVTHEGMQNCMMTIKVVDKQAPKVTCPANVTLACTADLAQYNPIMALDIEDCSPPATVTFIDVLQSSGNCVGNINSQFLRTYTVLDDYNNAATCQQLISLSKVTLGNVDFPPNQTLNCFPAPNTSPASTGYPTVNGNNIVPGAYCNLSATYTVPELIVPGCGGSYKIFRTWIATDWCAGNQSSTAMQIIEVVDNGPPVVTAPADMTVSTSALSCTANAMVPAAMAQDNCSGIKSVRMQGTFGTIHSNGGLIPNLPIGVHAVTFIATDHCNNEGSDIMFVAVQDLQPPVPVCRTLLAIPVNNAGTATIPAHVFNAASSDNCGPVYFKVKRMSTPVGYACANPGNPGNAFDDFIQFCCGDIDHNNIMVVFRVYDVPPVPGPVADTYLSGHFNDCMVQVEVQDKLPPQIICPSDITISCEYPFTVGNLDEFGSIALSEVTRQMICIDDPGVPGNPGLQCIGLDGLATDNCHVDIDELDPVVDLDSCGTGTIVRTFTATDDGNLLASCQQTISIINYDPFGYIDINWPDDLTTFDICEIDSLDPKYLSYPHDKPVLKKGQCDLVSFNYEDDVFDFSNSDQACFKILRTWTVVDWCQLNLPSEGIWSRIQVIKVMNTMAPVIEELDDRDECSNDPQCQGMTLDFEAVADDDCSGPASLTWRYFVDEDDDQDFETTSGEITGESIEFSRFMPIGTHRILYTVWDLCGNSSTEEQYVTVTSCKGPSAKCIHGISTNLMAMDPSGGMVTVQAKMFDAGSDHPCGNAVTVAFSENPLNVSEIFTCQDIGENTIFLWAIDQNGLMDVCSTYVLIQDNNGICPPTQGGTGVISGKISVPGYGSLSGATVYLDGSNLPGIPTGSEGYFVFPAMQFGDEYVVRPVREGDAKNGVSTLDLLKLQMHLLGLQTFSTPYEFIAADANNSSSITAIDIIQLRKLILGVYEELPNNTSWRFIDQAHVFPDPYNPWISSWPETYSIIPFNTSMNEVDFAAVKIGDLNKSANLSAGSGILLPRGGQSCELEYTINPQAEEGLFRIDVYLLQSQLYKALQLSFNWDQAGYSLMDWSTGELISREDIRMPDQPGQNASISTFTTEGWQDEKLPLLTLWVKQAANSRGPFQLFLNPRPTTPVAYLNTNEEAVQVQLKSNQALELKIYNRPNPFRDLTTIYVMSDKEEKASLRIYDLNGRRMLSRDVNLVRGENEFPISKTELREPGIYMYEIESNFQYSANRMIIVN